MLCKRNKCFNNKHSGIVIRGKGGCIWDNVCFANGYNGIGIEGVRASANVYHNQTYNNKMLGIFVAGMRSPSSLLSLPLPSPCSPI